LQWISCDTTSIVTELNNQLTSSWPLELQFSNYWLISLSLSSNKNFGEYLDTSDEPFLVCDLKLYEEWDSHRGEVGSVQLDSNLIQVIEGWWSRSFLILHGVSITALMPGKKYRFRESIHRGSVMLNLIDYNKCIYTRDMYWGSYSQGVVNKIFKPNRFLNSRKISYLIFVSKSKILSMLFLISCRMLCF
jgi:hypothetical protein